MCHKIWHIREGRSRVIVWMTHIPIIPTKRCWVIIVISSSLIVVIELLLVAELTLSNMLGPLVPIITIVVIIIWSVTIIVTLEAIWKWPILMLIRVMILTIAPSWWETIWVIVSPIIITRIVLSIPIVVVLIWWTVISTLTIIYLRWITPIKMSGWSRCGTRPISITTSMWTIVTVGWTWSWIRTTTAVVWTGRARHFYFYDGT